MSDVLQRTKADGDKAVATFLPSIANPPKPLPPPPNPMAQENPYVAAGLSIKRGNAVLAMAQRSVRGLPPDKPKDPVELFGNVLDVAHTRALSRAIANHPEEEQGRLLSEAHDSATKWIAAHNGKVVVHGQIKTADSAKAAEGLAAQIVNDTVKEHDEREAGDAEGDEATGESKPAASRPAQRPLDRPGVRTGPSGVRPKQAPAPNPRVAAQPSLPPAQPPDNGSAPGPGTVLDAQTVTDPPASEVPPEPAPTVSPEETPQVEATALDSGDEISTGNNLSEPNRTGNTDTDGGAPPQDTGELPAKTVPPAKLNKGDAIPLSMEPDGSQGTDLPSPDPGNDEQLPSGIPERRPQGGNKSKQLKKGDAVTLRDGSKAEVQWHHPGARLLRVKIDGRNHMVDPDKDLA